MKYGVCACTRTHTDGEVLSAKVESETFQLFAVLDTSTTDAAGGGHAPHVPVCLTALQH